jgi:hypothetical protein
MQHYVIKCVSDLWFLPGIPVTYRYDLTEILMKVALIT